MSLKTMRNARYRVLHLIGKGRMSEVYLVRNTLTNPQEALKVIRADASLPTHEVARFLDEEAKAIAALHHPHILPLLDYNEEVIDGSEIPYVVMPFCPGGSLSAWLHRNSNYVHSLYRTLQAFCVSLLVPCNMLMIMTSFTRM